MRRYKELSTIKISVERFFAYYFNFFDVFEAIASIKVRFNLSFTTAMSQTIDL